MSVLFDHKVEDILIGRKSIAKETLQEAKIQADEDGLRLERYLVDKGLVSGEAIALAISKYLNIPPVNLKNFIPEVELFALAPKETFLRHMIVPICRCGKMLTVALGGAF